MQYRRMPIEIESPEQLGYDAITNNLSESSFTDASLRDFDGLTDGLEKLVLCYGDHAGHAPLRRLLAGFSAGITIAGRKTASLSGDDVLLTIGAAGGLFIVATSLLEPGDELIVIRPNYATNIETPRAIGAIPRFIDLEFDKHFKLDPEALENSITHKTKYISVTYPHNPTGACLSQDEMNRLVAIAERHNLWLLVDETYRDMVFGQPLPLAAAWSEKAISISSLSKAYGLPGIRTGWIICRNRELMETFLAAKEQIHICGSVLDEEVAYRFLQQREKHITRIQATLKEKFGIMKEWMSGQADFEWVEPAGGAVCFPRIRHPEKVDLGQFYKTLLKKYGTYPGPGHWFEMPPHYFRVGFGWPTSEALRAGLQALEKSLRAATL